MMCRHCLERRATRAKQLCWHCSADASIRTQYQSTSKYAYRSQHERLFAARPCSEPTSTRPGTPERMEVLAQRAARCEDLWHRADADWTIDERALVVDSCTVLDLCIDEEDDP